MILRNNGDLINAIFNGYVTKVRGNPYHGNTKLPTAYMEIPLGTEIEVPLFLMPYESKMARNALLQEADKAVIPLEVKGTQCPYKTVDRNMKELLRDAGNSLLFLKSSCNNNDYYYIGTRGAIFDLAMTPMLIMAWKIKYTLENNPQSLNTTIHTQYLKPVIYINPLCYDLYDSVPKWITNAFFKAAVKVINVVLGHSVDVHIGDMPFTMHYAYSPKEEVENKKLLDCAVEHIDELFK